jgi:hypothetical protein
MNDLLYGADRAFEAVPSKLAPDLAEGVQRPADLDDRPNEIPDAPMPGRFSGWSCD